MDEAKTSVERKNLLAALRVCVHQLVEQVQGGAASEDHELLPHLCRILDACLSHGLQPEMVRAQRVSVSSVFGRAPRDTQHTASFWGYIDEVNPDIRDSCRETIRNMADLMTPRARGQAWLRLALMEKKLGDYIIMARTDENASRKHYLPHALMRSEDGQVMITLVDVLRPIDFTFCLKDERFDAEAAGPVDYAFFIELLRNSQPPPKTSPAPKAPERPNPRAKSPLSPTENGAKDLKKKASLSMLDSMQDMKEQLRLLQEQKIYLEDQLRERERALALERQLRSHIEIERDLARQDTSRVSQKSQAEMRTMQAIILELQKKLEDARAKSKYEARTQMDWQDSEFMDPPSVHSPVD